MATPFPSPEAAPANGASSASPVTPGSAASDNIATVIAAALSALPTTPGPANTDASGVLHECCGKGCTVRLCEGCARGNIWHTQHRTHFIDAKKCDWQIRKPSPKPRTSLRARQVRRRVGRGTPPASRKRVRFVGLEDDDEAEKGNRPAKRPQAEPPRQLAPKPVAQMGQVYEPLSTGRTPLPSMHPPRCTAGPSLLRNSDSYTRGAGPQVN
ncbi:uncharacterized protein QC761_0013760 [Podospora bellae-mahoneyi]|uniref:Uncharacterized protein n=1 Tax=Podospora bellae-mahoneyi TaxID=2093777 RepID=A0ABR0FZ11_9PEZI|nr:hypothetical protein QC761_0013760 [Podospora bellae-mahoneyi]